MLEGSILQKLDAAHSQNGRPLNLGVYYKNTLVALCHALEDFILESDTTPCKSKKKSLNAIPGLRGLGEIDSLKLHYPFGW